MKNITNRVATILLPCVFIFFLAIIFSPDIFKRNSKNSVIYAESISIHNLPREINMHVENTLIFNDLPYKIIPENCNAPVTVKILTNLGRPKEGASYKDKTFTATKTGLFYLRFCVDNAYGAILHDTIKVNVVHELDSSTKTIKVNTRAKDIYLGESIDLLTMVSIFNFDKEDINFNLNGKIFTNNIFTPTEVGNYTISINAQANGYALTDKLVVRVTPKPESLIKLYDLNYNLIDFTKPYLCNLNSHQIILMFELTGVREQIVECLAFNDKITILSFDSPLIIINLNDIGDTILTIFACDRTERLDLNILIQ